VINDMNTQIPSAAEEQSAVADDINRNVINIGQVANEVASGADESSAANADLTKLAAAAVDQSVQGLIQGPHRWQASSHRFCELHRSLWERACPR
jgi:methyl-accepting chemotaxis protein